MHDRARFSKKNIFSPKLRKWTKNGPKTGIYRMVQEFIEKFGH